MKNAILIILSIIISNLALGQSRMAVYNEYAEKADSLYLAKDFENAAINYQSAFDSNEGRAYLTHRYNAACSYAQVNNAEKAFYHLFYMAEHPRIKYDNYEQVSSESNLKPLYQEEQWQELLNLVKENKEEAERELDKTLIAILDTIYEEDQSYRMQIDEIESKYGRDSDEMKAHWKIINEKDSLNLIQVKKILDERGWLGPRVVGNKGNTTLFLVIQHADQETQEKYLPMMREAVKQGNAIPSSLAMLEDRVALGKGGKQIYGSQIGYNPETEELYVLPMIDPDNVDKRRDEVGLESMQEYISNWDLTWDVEAYKKELLKSEKAAKKK